MQIEIISDTICPWCFIGKRRLSRALSMRPQSDVRISWRPFQLNPEMPIDGMDRQHYLAAKFGGAERAGRMYDRIRAAGQEEGIDFHFERIRRTPNTVNSHRLLAHAETRNAQDAVAEALFHGYFVNGRDIGDLQELTAIASECGLDAAEVRRYLTGEKDVERIQQEDEQVRNMGVTGVPCFVIEGRYAVSGAQSPEVFFQIFDLVREEHAQAVS